MRFLLLAVTSFFMLCAPARTTAQLASEETSKERWRIGLVITAGSTPVTGITASVPVLMNWPEQDVAVVNEEFSPSVRRVSYKVLDGGVKQMVISIPKLAAAETANAVLTYEIHKRFVAEPEHPGDLIATEEPPSPLRKFLLPSPYIDSKHERIESLAREIVAEHDKPWDQVSAIYDWVRNNVRYKFDTQIKDSVQAIEDGEGDCEELTSVFIALCRANNIPARAVWVPGHCYPEFYLLDTKGNGHWIPCQAAGARAFGQMPETRPILQKGDNFRIQGHRKPLRYVQPTLVARDAGASPSIRWVMEKVEAE
jgi:hypothetical protein